MALTATIYNFDIDLADSDRGRYESFALRVARHPSESEEYLVTRVLAYCLEFTDGLAFSSGGLSEPDDPALSVRDPAGMVRTWIEIGFPDAAKLHKACKAAHRVVVYPHRDPAQWLRQLSGERIHRAAGVEIYVFEPAFVRAFAAHLERRVAMSASVTDRHLLVAFDRATLETGIARHALAVE